MNLNRLLCEGIECEYLVKLPEKDYTDAVKSIEISSPVDFVNEDSSDIETIEIPLSEPFLNPRLGISISDYNKFCSKTAKKLFEELKGNICKTDDVLIIGTEKFMYPAIKVRKQQCSDIYMRIGKNYGLTKIIRLIMRPPLREMGKVIRLSQHSRMKWV